MNTIRLHDVAEAHRDLLEFAGTIGHNRPHS
jgi:hypothetical protein